MASMSGLFASYLIVDWSAANIPRTGPDSIWFCLLERRKPRDWRFLIENPPTRQKAFQAIRALLVESMRLERATLLGFDFPLGFPAGLAAALQLPLLPPWRAIWKELHRSLLDRPDNDNNRFQLAAAWNQRLTASPAPFWGCPESQAGPFLQPTKPPLSPFPEFRLTDHWGPKKAQSPWKLYTTGSVGSQALTGIPYALRLAQDPALAPFLKVWPFETGLAAPFGLRPHQPRILLAEVYPSLLPLEPQPNEVKDAAQVRSLAQFFARLDEAGKLARLFAGPASLSADQRAAVEQQEGWILGIGA
jgi:hypothetical protein